MVAAGVPVVSIRLVGTEEPVVLAAIGAVSVRAFDAAMTLGDEYRAELADPSRRLLDYEILVLEVDGAVVGTASLLRPGHRPPVPLHDGEQYMRILAVDPAHARRGHAAALLQRVEDHAAGAGARAVVLNTAPEWTAAMAFYTARGYERDEERSGVSEIDGHEVDYVTFVRPLQS